MLRTADSGIHNFERQKRVVPSKATIKYKEDFTMSRHNKPAQGIRVPFQMPTGASVPGAVLRPAAPKYTAPRCRITIHRYAPG